MDFGFVFNRLAGDPVSPNRSTATWISDAGRIMETANRAGFSFISLPGRQSLLTFARLSAASGNLRVSTEVLTMPMLSAVEVASAAVNVDHMTEGRLDLGIGLGYHPVELEAAGMTRSDRVPHFEEGLVVMKALWTGKEVTHHGKYYNFNGLQVPQTPFQQPHPPLWMSSQSHGAAVRAARLCDGLVVAPMPSFDDMKALVGTFNEEWSKNHGEPCGRVGAWRGIVIGKDPEDAHEKARADEYMRFESNHRYKVGRMEETTTVRLPMNLDELPAFTILGNHEQCAEQLAWCQDEAGLSRVTLNIHNTFSSISEKLEWLQAFGEEVIPKLN
jgi:alkanesulfonate monooxygenase SsuD/methylene tetrahydromethanopterin reductase-like flavin-dependent oxidoreductase (luciferase family)